MTEYAYAIASQDEALHVGMAAVLSVPDWWAIPENRAIGIAMKATGGLLEPGRARDELRHLVSLRGIQT